MIALRLSDLDLQLFLSGSLRPGQAFLLRIQVSCSLDLRRRLNELRAQNSDFAAREMPRLRKRLGFDASSLRWMQTPPPRRSAPLRFAFGAGTVVLAGLAIFSIFPTREVFRKSGQAASLTEQAAAKGTALGVVLYARGDSTWKIAGSRTATLGKDTLQILPLPGNPQHLLLFGWEADGGFTRIFPGTGEISIAVSPQAPPPSVTLTGLSDHVLICVTSASLMRADQVLRRLRQPPLWPLLRAPHSHLSEGIYFQIFVLRKKSA